MAITSAEALAKVNVIRTGTVIDRLSGIGGIPRGRITEVWGDSSTGKTTVLLQAIAEAQKQGLKCLFADVEHSFEARYAKAIGVDTEKLHVLRESIAEEVLDTIEKEVKNYDLIVLDAIGALLPRQEAEKAAGEKTIGGQAGLVARFCRKVVPILSMEDIALVVLNHSFIDIMTGAVKTSGGAKLDFHKSLSIRLKWKGLWLKQGDKKIGKVITASVKKNKLASTEGMEIDANIIFGDGFSSSEDLLSEAIERGVFERIGNTFHFRGEKIGTMSKLREWAKENEQTLKEALA